MVPLNGVAALGVLWGVVLGLGLWLVLSAVPRIGRPRLAERVAPFLTDISAEARVMVARRSADPSPVLGLVVAPVDALAAKSLGRLARRQRHHREAPSPGRIQCERRTLPRRAARLGCGGIRDRGGDRGPGAIVRERADGGAHRAALPRSSARRSGA